MLKRKQKTWRKKGEKRRGRAGPSAMKNMYIGI